MFVEIDRFCSNIWYLTKMIVDCFYNCLIKNSNYDDVVAKIENNFVQILLTIKITNILNFIKILNSMNDVSLKLWEYITDFYLLT